MAVPSCLAPGRWRELVSWLVAAALLVWLLAQVDLQAVEASLRVIYPGWLAAALLSVVATVVLRVARWRALLMNTPGAYPAWTPLWRAILWGQALNLLLPFRAGDLARAYGVKKLERSGDGEAIGMEHAGHIGAAYALGTIGAEKLLDLAWLGGGLLLVFLGGEMPDLSALLPASRTGVLLLALSGALALAWLLSRTSFHGSRSWPAWRRAVVGNLQRLGAGLAVLGRSAVLWPAVAWSVPLWLSHVFNNYATARALALPMDWRGALLVLVVLQAGLAPPSTPAKIGVFQALCVASLRLLGHDLAAGLVYGFVLQWVVMLPPLILWLANRLLERAG